MGKKNSSNEDLQSAIRDLGGDEDDLKMLEDADFSGSDFEDADPKDARNLADDVAKMWKELSGDANGSGSKETKRSDAKKSDAKKAVPESTSQKAATEPKADASKAKNESKSKETKSKEPKNKANAKEPKAQEKTEPKQGSKQASKPDLASAPNHEAHKPKAPTVTPPKPLSKKQRQAWDQYIASLAHPKSSLLIEDGQKWYELGSESAASTPEIDDREVLENLKAKAQELLDVDNQLYFKERMSDREFSSSLEFLKSGTFSDQLGTLSILSTDSPIHSVKFLTTLESKCEVKHRESACKALEVAKDLLVSHVLPDRRLRWFREQPIKIGVSMPTLVAWCFEDFLKRYFFQILQVMERLLSDTVENIRSRTLNCVFSFFQQKPEQEANLLRLGLNKLGDPAGKVASKVKRLLMDALQMHPGMKPIVATAMAELLGRTSDYRTRYYSVDTLSEFILSNRDSGLANQLIYIYLSLFERLLAETKDQKDERVEKAPAKGKPKTGKRFRQKRGKKGGISQAQTDSSEMENQQHARLVAKIFTGLNRAFPFSNLDPAVFAKYTDTLYHMSHSSNVGTFIEALSFIFQLSRASSSGNDDRYYRALYDSLLDNRLPHSSKLGKYIHLMLRSMAELKAESEVARGNAFAKRALQIACNLSEVGAAASLIHVASMTPHVSRLANTDTESSTADEYNPKQRDPRYAKAETSKAWEVVLLQQHFHPTVSLYANNIVVSEAEKIALDAPDIDQYSVNSFLSKWSYKKPKAKESTRGGSIFQPLSGFTDLTLGIRQQKKSGEEVPASMQNWKQKNAKDVAPEEKFLYEYFSTMPEKKPKKTSEADGAKTTGDDSDAESISEDEISEAMSRNGPGDLGGAEINVSDMSDDEEDGDLEEDLAKAFADEDDDEDEGEEDGADEGDLDGLGDDDESGDEAPSTLGDEDFANFEEDTNDLEAEEEASGDKKKRKRGWTNYPTFLDADSFEEMFAKEQQSKKRR